ncbi:DUF2793 domain-containing protein [Sphingobium sp. LMA1-1-1.1]|uniref:DUF2793 domain-containing protein n=1 Tax=Sphingobium sp. LMA1-1-1.1 TaxID=3135238 RepID=UPI00343BAB73
MTDFPNTGAPMWAGPQASPWDVVNEASFIFDAFASRSIIEDRDLTAPPGSCANGARYLVDATATGAWAGHDGELAIAIGANASNGWYFATVDNHGNQLFVRDEDILIEYDGAAWVTAPGGVSYLNDLTDVNAPAPADNDLLSWDEGAGQWVPVAAAAGYTDEQARDAIGAMLADSSTIDVTYNDEGDAETFEVIQAALKPTESLIIACSDETTAITAGTAKVTFRMPYAFTLTAVRASVTTAPTGSTILIDINESGTTILSTKLMIDASEKTSTTAATAAVISDSGLADDAEITIDFDQVGSTIAGAGVKVYLIGHRT